MSTTRANIPVNLIDDPPGREHAAPFRKEVAEQIAASIKGLGLLQPIGVRPIAGTERHELVFGRHRLSAVRDHLKEEAIPAVVFESYDDETAELACLAENLCRNVLKRGEFLLAMSRWVRLYDAKYPDQVNDARRANATKARAANKRKADQRRGHARLAKKDSGKEVEAPAPSFTKLVAEVTGQSEMSASRTARIARAFTEDQLAALDACKANLGDIYLIAAVKDKEVRGKVVDLVAAGVDPSEAIARVTGKKQPKAKPAPEVPAVAVPDSAVSDEEAAAFNAAVERFKAKSGRRFPTLRELLTVAKEMGYSLPSQS